MSGNGVMIGMIVVITAAVHKITLPDPKMVVIVFCVAVRGTTTLTTAGLPIASTLLPLTATATAVFVLPGLSDDLPFTLFPCYPFYFFCFFSF